VIGEVVALQQKLAWYGKQQSAAVFAQPLAKLA
jgi:hypothetical protein